MGTGAFFPGIIRSFRQLHPGVQFSVMEMLSRAQPEALLNGSIDVGFMRPLEPPYDSQLRSELLYTDPVVAVLPADHRLAGGPLRLQELADEHFVVCDRNIAPTFFDKITSLCAQAGFSPKIVQTSNLVSSVLTLVEAGEGVTLLPSGLQHSRFSDLSFCPLIDPGAASIWSWRGLQIAKEKRTKSFLISCAARRNSSEAQSKSDSGFMVLVPRQTASDNLQ